MTQSPNEDDSDVRAAAKLLALELGDFEPVAGLSVILSEMLTPTQNALVSDSFGLLNGISFGTVTNGQPRICDNLLRIIAELPDTPQNQPVIKALCSVISRAATSGLTAENQLLAVQKHQRLR